MNLDAKLLDAIQRAVRNETGNPHIVLQLETTPADVPGWDSVAHGLIMLTLEGDLGCRINIETTYSATCVGELIPILRAAMEDRK